MKGKNGIHLDNKEHAILEHCVGPNGDKLIATELNIVFFIDPDHLECAEAHRDKMKKGHSQSDDFDVDASVNVGLDMVCFFS